MMITMIYMHIFSQISSGYLLSNLSTTRIIARPYFLTNKRESYWIQRCHVLVTV